VITAGGLLARLLRAAGIDAVYGAPAAGLGSVPVGDRRVAAALAGAHERVHGLAAAVLDRDGRLHLGGVDVPACRQVRVREPEDLVGVAVSPGAAMVIRLDVDLGAPAPDDVPAGPGPEDRWLEPDPDQAHRLGAARNPVVLAGPGVVRDRAVPGLNALAASGSLGVLNTWGAKGVFDWRSRHHFATVGLQARDFELGGLAGADLIVATGIDPAEAPPERWVLAPVLDVAPGQLSPLAERWSRPRVELEVPPLRAGLSRVTQEGWASAGAPMAPSRVTLGYSRCFGAGGLVAADPGTAGYWVARTFGTTEPGSVVVPAESDADGFAAACALVARLRRPSRAVLAVVDGPISGATGAVLDAAASLGVGVPLECWDPSGPRLGPEDHVDRLRRLALADHPAPVAVATDAGQLGRMIAVAGPVVAWPGRQVAPS